MITVNLSRLLEDRRMSQAELSRRAGIRPNAISNLVRRSTDRFSFYQLDRICDVLDCDLSELLTRVPNPRDRENHSTQKTL